MRWTGRATKMAVEPPAVLLTDLAFNLVIFFVVCASTDPQSGRRQNIPGGSKDKAATQQAAQNVEVALTRTTVAVNGIITPLDGLKAKLQPMLEGKTRNEERMVVVRSSKDTNYGHWVRVTALIEQAGGVIAFELEESRDVVVP